MEGLCELSGCIDLQKPLRLDTPLNLCAAIEPVDHYWSAEKVEDKQFGSCKEALDWLDSTLEAGYIVPILEGKWDIEALSGDKKKFTITPLPSPDMEIVVYRPTWEKITSKQEVITQKIVDALMEHERGHLYLMANTLNSLPPITVIKRCTTQESCDEAGKKLVIRYVDKWHRFIKKANELYDDATQGGSTQSDVGGVSTDFTIECESAEIEPKTIDEGTYGQSYFVGFSFVYRDTDGGVNDGTAIDNVQWTQTGPLPSGLQFSPDGSIAGTPTQLGIFPITITALATDPWASGQVFLTDTLDAILVVKQKPDPLLPIVLNRQDFIHAANWQILPSGDIGLFEDCSIKECSGIQGYDIDSGWGYCGYPPTRWEKDCDTGLLITAEIPSNLYGEFTESVSLSISELGQADSSTTITQDGPELIIEGDFTRVRDVEGSLSNAHAEFNCLIAVPPGYMYYKIEWDCLLGLIDFGDVNAPPIVNESQDVITGQTVSCEGAEGILPEGDPNFYTLYSLTVGAWAHSLNDVEANHFRLILNPTTPY